MSRESELEVGFGDYLGVFKRRSMLFFGVAGAILLLGVIIAYRMPPRFTATGVLLAEEPEVSGQVVHSTVTDYPEERVRVITQRVLTNDNLQKIIDDKHLYPELAGMPPEARSEFRSHIALSAEDPEILESIMGSTKPVGAMAFSLSFSDPRPLVARDVAKDLVALYLEENQRAREEQATQTIQFLTDESHRLETEIADREKKLADFKTKNAGALPTLALTNMQLLDRAQRDLDAVEQEIRTLRERQALYSSELAQISPQATVLNDQGEPILSPVDRMKMLQRTYAQLSAVYGPGHPDVLKVRRELEALSSSTGLPAFDRDTLQAELAARQDELAAARDKYSESHPDVQRLEKTIAGLKKAIASAGSSKARPPQITPDNPAYIQKNSQLREASVDLQAALQRREELRARLNGLEGRLTTSPEVERDYNTLNRGYQQLVEQYNDTQRKLREAQASLNLEQDSMGERFTVLEQPSMPLSPSEPNRLAVMLLTIVLALGLGAGTVALRERTDATVRHPRDVLAFLDIPPLVAIPYVCNRADIRRRARRWWLAATAACAWAATIVFLILTPAA